MVSVTGYGIALMFALQGAPDLALTQMLVETIILVAFVLAMRSLPAELRDRTGGKYRVVRVIIGLSFGATMVFAAIHAMGARSPRPSPSSSRKLAYEGGGGLNIVNVTLVDIRAWDTFGEISVLALAATGVASLIFVRGRGDRLARRPRWPRGPWAAGTACGESSRDGAALALSRKFAAAARDAWLVAGRTLAPERRSIIFEVVTRLIFHSMIIFSLYLLLAGHNLPGGGFAGGLMAGLALTLRYLAGGRFELREATPVSAGTLLGIGLATAALSGVGAAPAGRPGVPERHHRVLAAGLRRHQVRHLHHLRHRRVHRGRRPGAGRAAQPGGRDRRALRGTSPAPDAQEDGRTAPRHRQVPAGVPAGSTRGGQA